MSEINENTPWYKQIMVWMVITPPLTAVIAGIITINIAIDSDDGLVVDDYYKQGLGINQTLHRDQLAREMKLSASIVMKDHSLSMTLATASSEPVLLLKFIHPTQSNRDVEVKMTQLTAVEYQGQLNEGLSGSWNLTLEPENKIWRLGGRAIMPLTDQASLLPNLK